MEDLLERVVAIAQGFDRAEIPHSFGGAIALAYYGSARPTRDIDINVYLAVGNAGRALDSLHELGVPEADEKQWAKIRSEGQVRLFWDEIPLDLFFWNLDFHASCCERRRQYTLEDHTIDVLSPEDLIVCKVAFARSKDARDISLMLDFMGASLDVAYLLRWVTEIVGTDTDAAQELIHALKQRSLLPDP